MINKVKNVFKEPGPQQGWQRKMLNRRRLMIVSLIGLCAFTSCSKYSDALVINPCAEGAAVKLSSNPSPPSSSDFQWAAATSVNAVSARRVEDVFATVGTADFSAEVTIGSNSPQRLRIPFNKKDPVLVIIPARLCGS